MIQTSVTALLHLGASHKAAPAQGTRSPGVTARRGGCSRHHEQGQGRTAEQTGKTTALDNKSNASRKRGAYETCLARLTLGWHQGLSEPPAKRTPAIAAWFLSRPRALQPPSETRAHLGVMSLFHCCTQKGGSAPFHPSSPRAHPTPSSEPLRLGNLEEN